MPIYDARSGSDLFIGYNTFSINKAYANGTTRQLIRGAPSAKRYGAKRVTPPGLVKPITGREAIKQAFQVESQVRNTRLGAFKEVEGMRGRSKSAYNIISGKGGKRMALTAPQSGQTVSGVGQALYVGAGNVPLDVPSGSVEMGTGMPWALGQLTEATVPAEELWKRDLESFSKDVAGFHMFTTNSQEIRAYEKGVTLVKNGRTIFANNPQVMAGVNAINGELVRWRNDRAWALTKAPGTNNQFSHPRFRPA